MSAIWLQAYFISVVWSCYKFLCQTCVGQSAQRPHATDFEMELVRFDRAIVSSSAVPMAHHANATNLTLGTELMVCLVCATAPFLGHLRDELINPVKKSVHTYVCTSTTIFNAATNQIVVFVKVDETFTTIWLSRSSEVRVKVTWWFSNSISSAIFQPIKKIPTVFDTRPKYRKSRAGFLNFLLVIESCDFKVCQKINKNFFSPILMKLCMMLEVDEKFTTIWLSRSSTVRVKVRRWPQSPLGTIFMFSITVWGLGLH